MFIIGFVNYKSSIYMNAQINIYKRYAGEEFKVIIADTSLDKSEHENLKMAVLDHGVDVEVVEFEPLGKHGSQPHGEGLQFIYNKVVKDYDGAEYLLIQDPDFFWVKKSFLTHIRKLLNAHEMVGGQYKPGTYGASGPHPKAPAAFGCAFKMKSLIDISADFRVPQTTPRRDVGWMVREKLWDKPYYYFKTEDALLNLGKYAEVNLCAKYTDNGVEVAYHLFRGSFTGKPGQPGEAPAEWQESRKRISKYMLEKISHS